MGSQVSRNLSVVHLMDAELRSNLFCMTRASAAGGVPSRARPICVVFPCFLYDAHDWWAKYRV